MIRLELQGDPVENLDRLLRRIANPGRGEVEKVADVVRQGYQGVFTNQGGASGAWRALAPMTVIDRIEKGFAGNRPILVRTGRLRASFVQRGATDHVDDYSTTSEGWELEVGSNDERSHDLHFGTRRIPARPIVDLSPEAEERIASVIDFVIGEMTKRELR